MNNTRLGAEILREYTPTEEDLAKLKRNDIYIILDNVLDTYNIGAIFRLADAVGVKKIYLCEGSETPPNHRIKKASVNTWQWINWEYFEKTTDAIDAIRKEIPDVTVVAVELDEKAIDYTNCDFNMPVALVVGHESDGVKQEVMDKCDQIVQLPMLGINKSLNVMVSLGIVLYEVVEKNKL